MLESTLVTQCIAWVKANGGDAWKVHGGGEQRSGEPDIDGAIIWAGQIIHFKIELKVGANTPSAIQIKRLERWAKYGYCVGVAYSLGEFRERITTYDASEPCWTYAEYQNRKRHTRSNGNDH
jgi:hypothetical protein